MARMSAVEEMAGMDILCSDKTGTLTLNELTVDKPNVLVTVPGMPVDEVRSRCGSAVQHVLLLLLLLLVDVCNFSACQLAALQLWSQLQIDHLCNATSQALILGALSANISSEEPIDMVMHESAPGHETLWDRYKQVGQGLVRAPVPHSRSSCACCCASVR